MLCIFDINWLWFLCANPSMLLQLILRFVFVPTWGCNRRGIILSISLPTNRALEALCDSVVLSLSSWRCCFLFLFFSIFSFAYFIDFFIFILIEINYKLIDSHREFRMFSLLFAVRRRTTQIFFFIYLYSFCFTLCCFAFLTIQLRSTVDIYSLKTTLACKQNCRTIERKLSQSATPNQNLLFFFTFTKVYNRKENETRYIYICVVYIYVYNWLWFVHLAALSWRTVTNHSCTKTRHRQSCRVPCTLRPSPASRSRWPQLYPWLYLLLSAVLRLPQDRV